MTIWEKLGNFFNPIWPDSSTVRAGGSSKPNNNNNTYGHSSDNIDYTMPNKNPLLVRQDAYITVGSNTNPHDDGQVIHLVPVSGSASSNNNPHVVQPDFNNNQNISNFKQSGSSISASSSTSHSSSGINPADLPTNTSAPSLVPTVQFTVDSNGNKTYEASHGKTIIERQNRLPPQQQPQQFVDDENKTDSTLQYFLLAGIVVSAYLLKN